MAKGPGFWSELFAYAKQRKKWWLLPIMIVLIFVGILVIFTTNSAVLPFIYTLF